MRGVEVDAQSSLYKSFFDPVDVDKFLPFIIVATSASLEGSLGDKEWELLFEFSCACFSSSSTRCCLFRGLRLRSLTRKVTGHSRCRSRAMDPWLPLACNDSWLSLKQHIHFLHYPFTWTTKIKTNIWHEYFIGIFMFTLNFWWMKSTTVRQSAATITPCLCNYIVPFLWVYFVNYSAIYIYMSFINSLLILSSSLCFLVFGYFLFFSSCLILFCATASVCFSQFSVGTSGSTVQFFICFETSLILFLFPFFAAG